MKVLELFAGSRSFGKAAESLGFDVFSSDINDFANIDYVVDILKFDINKLPYKIDIIWASPPCTYFSVASIGKHWNKDHTPKTNEAIFGVKVVKQTIKIIEQIKPKHWYIENPRGKLRKLDFMQTLPRTTIWYCKYGDTRAKPTDIWSNSIRSILNPNGWQPRAECFNGNKNCHHEAAPRGSRTGTQGLKGNYERSKIPKELCLEILKTIK
jgi:site-specific DNA-cytosine methylase|tara:strand:+ start:671 stop:1303 length:633 start_codon:yes stop_codon:yes gene_type:complete